MDTYKSRVYTDRPDYADFAAPAKFSAIQSIIARRLIEHPKAICSYSGGSDSDIMIDLIERTRKAFELPPVDYVFFNTGLEMQATKNHLKATAENYDIEIKPVRPKIGIVQATRKYGIPLISKAFSGNLSRWQKNNIPLSVTDEYEHAEDKQKKFRELNARYPNNKGVLEFLCSCVDGEPIGRNQFRINSAEYFLDFMKINPPDFKISSMCCNCCKKQPAHHIEKDYDMIITGERKAEGGQRSILRHADGYTECFTPQSNNQYRLRPLYYVSDTDKAWYKEQYDIHYSDAYEVYGLTRTGCCGCPISYKAVEDLEKIRPYEPNVVKAAWNIFGASYEYRQKYNAYKEKRKNENRTTRRG